MALTDARALAQALLSFFMIPRTAKHADAVVVDLEKAPPAAAVPARQPKMDYLGTLVMVSRARPSLLWPSLIFRSLLDRRHRPLRLRPHERQRRRMVRSLALPSVHSDR